MTFFPDMKTVLTIGSLQVTWYAVLILSGAFLAYFYLFVSLRNGGIRKRYLKTSF